MYYEEREINGVWHYRTLPNGEWRVGRITPTPAPAELVELPEPVRMSSDQAYMGFTADQMHAHYRKGWDDSLAAHGRVEVTEETARRFAQAWFGWVPSHESDMRRLQAALTAALEKTP